MSIYMIFKNDVTHPSHPYHIIYRSIEDSYKKFTGANVDFYAFNPRCPVVAESSIKGWGQMLSKPEHCLVLVNIDEEEIKFTLYSSNLGEPAEIIVDEKALKLQDIVGKLIACHTNGTIDYKDFGCNPPVKPRVLTQEDVDTLQQAYEDNQFLRAKSLVRSIFPDKDFTGLKGIRRFCKAQIKDFHQKELENVSS